MTDAFSSDVTSVQRGGNIKKIAVYTTIYPGVEGYLADWHRSLQEQTDQDYALWIGLDTLTVDAAIEAMGSDPKATWVTATSGDTPAQVRQRALERLLETCDGVVLVDSDDIMHPSRVASAREYLRISDLAGCALRLVDQEGADIGFTLGLPSDAAPGDVLPRNNIFGLSNTAYRSEVLRHCLPITADVTLVDWYLATRAWLRGARLVFDPVIRMDYRQHGANMARVVPPFSPLQVISDCERVRHHFQILLSAQTEGVLDDRLGVLARVASDVEVFRRHVVLHPEMLENYVQALNGLELPPLWWSCVAHPALQYLWTPSRRQYGKREI